MNEILKYGFARPYIIFQFESGEVTIDTIPPRYFVSFENNRTCDKACQFKLTLSYVPGTAGEDNAAIAIQQQLLSQINKPVRYQYGFYTADRAAPILQNQAYSGILLQYEESLDGNTLSYILSGTSQEIDSTATEYDIHDFMETVKKAYPQEIQPSMIVDFLCLQRQDLYETEAQRYANLYIRNNAGRTAFNAAQKTGIPEYMAQFDKDIDHDDDAVETSGISIEGHTVHDIFCGRSCANGTGGTNGLVYYSKKSVCPNEILSSMTLAQRFNTFELSDRDAQTAEILRRYSSQALEDFSMQATYTQKYVAFFDNVISGLDSQSKGTFHYKPQIKTTADSEFVFNYGNTFLDSDVLSFNATIDCTIAYAAQKGRNAASSNIDAGGEYIGGTYVTSQTDNFVKNSYTTLSGFKDEAGMTETTIADALTLPFTATMEVLGQINECNKLLDFIDVTVMMNGKLNVGLTGKYVVKGVTDSLSSNGFTTSFDLIRYVPGQVDVDSLLNDSNVEYMAVSTNSGAYDNQQALNKSHT